MRQPCPVEPILTAPFACLWAAHFLQALGFSSMLLLPLYLAHLGASRTEIGAVMATAAFGGLASRPAVGKALDVLGRKPVLVLGTLVLVLGMVSVWFVRDMGPLVYAMRLLVGIGTGALFTGYFTLAADLVPSSRRTEGIALFGISGLAPLLVNPLRDVLALPPPALRWFLPLIGVSILGSLLFLPGVPERSKQADAPPFAWSGAAEALRQRPLWPVWLATMVFAALVAVFMSFATVAAEARGVAAPTTVWATYAAGAVLVRLFGARLPERLGGLRVGGAALLAYAAGLAVAGSATDTLGFALAGALGGIGHGYCFPVLTTQVVDRSPVALRGMAMATFTGLWDLARLLAGPIFGFVADRAGDRTMLSGAGLCGALGWAAWVLLERWVGRARQG